MRDVRAAIRLVVAFVGAVVLVPVGVSLAGQAPAAPTVVVPVVYSAVVDSIIHPVSAEFMVETIDEADRAGASLVIFTLRTPGGLVDSTRDIITRMLSAKTPVAVFVAPSGARAASAGFLLTVAADVAAMAPGTHIGAAHPVSGNGQQMDETTSKKAAEDVAAYVRTLAGGRHRNVELSEAAVNQSRAFTETEALAATPALIDVVSRDVPDLLRTLDGRTIARFDGSSVVLRTAGATVVNRAMSLRQRILSTIAHPNVAYILLSLGVLGLTIELWNPGAILPGVVGGLSLLLAFFALQVLPFNFAGLLLVGFGLLLLVLEIKVTSFGLLTLGGVVSLVAGSLMLVDHAAAPELQLSLQLVLAVVLGFGGIGVFLVRLGVASQRQPAATGSSTMLGRAAEALTPIGPERPGQVRVRGEIWQARSSTPVASGTTVRITQVDGLTLTVRPEKDQP